MFSYSIRIGTWLWKAWTMLETSSSPRLGCQSLDSVLGWMWVWSGHGPVTLIEGTLTVFCFELRIRYHILLYSRAVFWDGNLSIFFLSPALTRGEEDGLQVKNRRHRGGRYSLLRSVCLFFFKSQTFITWYPVVFVYSWLFVFSSKIPHPGKLLGPQQSGMGNGSTLRIW